MNFSRYLLPLGLLLTAGVAAYGAVDWIWGQLEDNGRRLLLVTVSVVLYGFGRVMDKIVQRSGKNTRARQGWG